MDLDGKPIRRPPIINSICEEIDDLVVLSSTGYWPLLFFLDNTIATLKMIKDDDEDVNIDAALDIVVKLIRNECSLLRDGSTKVIHSTPKFPKSF